jgi:hypothetical protein
MLQMILSPLHFFEIMCLKAIDYRSLEALTLLCLKVINNSKHEVFRR